MSQQIAVLGAGVMGGTLLSSILGAGHRPADLVVGEKRVERAEELRARFGVRVTDNAEAVRGADVVLIAVKPQDVPALLTEIAGAVEPGAVVLSLAAGVRIATFHSALGDQVAVVRAMPNTPALVAKGVFGVSPGPTCSPEQLDLIVGLLAPAGHVEVVDEADQDAVTAVSGSGPAYVFYLAEQLIAAGVEAGLTPAVAGRLAVGTIEGAAALLASSDAGPGELRRQVTSPNGTTAAAIATFDDRGVGAGVRAGVAAAAARSAELSGGA